MPARPDAPAAQALRPDATCWLVLQHAHWLVAALRPDVERLRMLPGARWLLQPAMVRHEEAHSARAAPVVTRVGLRLERRAAVLLQVFLCEHWAQQLAVAQKKPAELVAVSPRRPAGSLPQQTV